MNEPLPIPVAIATLRRGTYCHSVEPMGEEVRMTYYRVDRRRPIMVHEGRAVVPVKAFGLTQGTRFNNVDCKHFASTYIDARLKVFITEKKPEVRLRKYRKMKKVFCTQLPSYYWREVE